MAMDFSGRVAIVTGAGKGLGRAYAHWLAERGASVVVNNRAHAGRPSSAEAVAQEIRAKGGIAIADYHAVDDEKAGAAMVETAVREFGKLDILVNNAGIVDDLPLGEMPLAKMHEVMNINFWGSLYPTRAALPHMMKEGYGRVVLSSSQAGLYGQKDAALYAASKAALIGFARAVGREIGDKADVRINVVTPAAYTPMSMKVLPLEWEDYLSPFKVAPVVGWLSSEACGESGMIFNAGAGRVRRARIIEGPAVKIENDDMNGCFPQVDAIADTEEAASSFHSGRELMPELFAANEGLTEKA